MIRTKDALTGEQPPRKSESGIKERDAEDNHTPGRHIKNFLPWYEQEKGNDAKEEPQKEAS